MFVDATIDGTHPLLHGRCSGVLNIHRDRGTRNSRRRHEATGEIRVRWLSCAVLKEEDARTNSDPGTSSSQPFQIKRDGNLTLTFVRMTQLITLYSMFSNFSAAPVVTDTRTRNPGREKVYACRLPWYMYRYISPR